MIPIQDLHDWISFKGYVLTITNHSFATSYFQTILKLTRGTKKVPRGTLTNNER